MSNLAERLANMPPERRKYTLQVLPAHQAEANQILRLQQLLWSFSFLQAKLDHPDISVNELIADFSLLPDDAWLGRLQRTVRQSAHIVNQDSAQLAGQLLGRLSANADKYEKLAVLLEEASQYDQQAAILPLVSLPNQGEGTVLYTLAEYPSSVESLALTPDDRYLIAAHDDSTIIIWDFANGVRKNQLKDDLKRVRQTLVVTPDGRKFVRSVDAIINVRDLETGVLRHRLDDHKDTIYALAITSDSRTLVSASSDTTLKIWDLESGVCLRTLSDHKNWVNTVIFIDDDQYALSAGGSTIGAADYAIRIWDWQTGQLIDMLVGHTQPVLSLTAIPGRKQIISVAQDGTRIWDVESGQVLDSFNHFFNSLAHVTGRLAFLPIENALIGITRRSLTIWDVETGEIRARFTDSAPIRDFAVTRDGRRAISAADERIKVWDLTQASVMQPSRAKWDLTKHGEPVMALTLTVDSHHAVSAFQDNAINVWDLTDGLILARNLSGHEDTVTALAATWDQKYVVSVSVDKTLRVWDITNGKRVCTLTGHTRPIRALSITPDGRYALTAAHRSGFGLEESVLMLWDLMTGEVIKTLSGHGHKVTRISLRSDGLYAYSSAGSVFGRRDYSIKVWDLRAGKVIGQLEGHREPVNGIALTLDGRYAVSVAGETQNLDNSVKVWDLQTGRTLQTHTDHTMRVNAVSMTYNGRYTASASHDQTIKVWNIFEGRRVASFSTDYPIIACAISANGRIVAGDEEGQLYYLSLKNVPVDAPIHLKIQYEIKS